MLMRQIAERLGVTTADEDDDEPSLLDTRVKPVVRILNGALDEDPASPNAIVLNGRLDPETFRHLKVDNSYQRPLGDRSDIYEAIKAGIVVPNIDIGVRGQDFSCDGDNFVIHSPAYIIDGWQRVGTALRILELIPNHPIRMFATVHFGTDEVWERHRFTELNKNIRKVSPNLHLRNMRDSTFFEVIDECWGIHNIEFRHGAPQIKSTFMMQLAKVFSLHVDFWDTGDRIFFVAADTRRKLAKFPINDPHVKNLAGTGGAAANILYDLMVSHINSGKRTGHLRPRVAK